MQSVLRCILTAALLPALAHAQNAAGDFSAMADQNLAPAGLVELRAIPGGVAGEFVSAGARVRFETQRGPELARDLRQREPNALRYETDVRFLDENGFPFFTQVGGHGPIDPSWQPETASDYAILLAGPGEPALRRAIAAAESALQALAGVGFRESVRDEQQALLALAPALREMLVIEKSEETSPSFETEEEHRSTPAAPAACTYKHRVEVHDKVFIPFYAKHSATLAKTISATGQTVQVWSSCNHGTCATSMSTKCSWTSTANRCSLIMSAPMCSTPFGYNPPGRCGVHVCNDDSLIQFNAIKNAYSPSPTAGTCSDCSLRAASPSCL